MFLTPRQRVIIACLFMALIGYSALSLYQSFVDSLHCYSLAVRAVNGCAFGARHLSVARLLLGISFLSFVVVATVVIARWCLRPFRDLTAMVERLGPQNLAERSPVTSGDDELGRLTTGINAMMDRLAAGYEGQRSFAANASHELRTPLAVQRTLIEVSMAGARTKAQISLLTDQLLATNERNERLIEGLLVLSESDRGLASRTPQRLDEIARDVVDVHRDMAAKADVTLRTELSERVVLGERVLLERLVTNLVRNAILYNVDGGEVSVVVGHQPAISVENTGADIAAESISGLFEPFRRGTADRTHHGGGAGLGLTIVRSIAQAHDGSVEARAGHLGTSGASGGLAIAVTLP